jgi:putative ABC transport system permease protein
MDARLNDEMRFHLEMATEQNLRAGMPADDARRAALLAFGGRDRWNEAARDEYRSRYLEELVRDVRYALRNLRRTPAFTAAVIATLALSVGATTSMFSVVNAVLLRRLPYPDPERIVVLCEHNLTNGKPCNSINPGNFLAWRAQSRSFASMGAFVDRPVSVAGGGREPIAAQARIATADVFSILGARTVAGRVFSADEDRPGGPDVMVISYRFWQQHFGGDPSIVGKPLLMQAYEYTVVGVAAPGFGLYEPVDLWIPARFAPTSASGRSLRAIARLRPNASLEQADREMKTMAARRAVDLPQVNTNWTALAMPLRENLVGGSQRALWVLLGAVGFLLVIACANVANLLLARAADRQREVAVRISLGASPARIVRQLLTESLVLSTVSAVIGLGIAVKGTRALVALVPSGMAVQSLDGVSVDWRVLLFTLAVAAITGIIFGVAPARQATRGDLQTTLKEGGRASAGSTRSHTRLRSALVVAEMSLALVLLAGAGLMTRSFAALEHVRLGFEPAHAWTGSVSLPRRRYASDTAIISFYQNLESRIAALPGVTAVGAISYLPLSGQRSASGFNVEGRAPAAPGQEPVGDMRAVTPGYFSAMGIRIRDGRALATTDGAATPSVAVVSETLARTFWPGESAVGHYLLYEWDKQERVQIVGVADDVHHDGADKSAFMEIYRPHTQFPYGNMTLVVRTSGDPTTYRQSIQRAIGDLDGNLPLADMRTMDSRVAESLGSTRLSAALFGLFGLLGLVLAAVGVYGVMSYAVQQRKHEIGVRMALGARPADVIRMIVRRGAELATIGIAIGTVGGLLLTRLMTRLLFGVAPHDATTFVAIAGLLAAVCLLATYLPGRRATKVDPLMVLRGE